MFCESPSTHTTKLFPIMFHVLTDCSLMEEFSKASTRSGLSDQLLIRNCLSPSGSVMKVLRGISSSIMSSVGSKQCDTNLVYIIRDTDTHTNAYVCMLHMHTCVFAYMHVCTQTQIHSRGRFDVVTLVVPFSTSSADRTVSHELSHWLLLDWMNSYKLAYTSLILYNLFIIFA